MCSGTRKMQSTVDARTWKQTMVVLIVWITSWTPLGIWISSLWGCNGHVEADCDVECRNRGVDCRAGAMVVGILATTFPTALLLAVIHVVSGRQKLIPARYKTFAFITDDGNIVIKDEIKQYFGQFHYLDHEVVSPEEIKRKPLDGILSAFATTATSEWAMRNFNSDDAIAKLHDACPPSIWVRHWFASHQSDDILVCVGKPSDVVRELVGRRGGVVIQITKTDSRMPGVNDDVAPTSAVADNKASVDAVIEYNGTDWDLRNQLRKLFDRLYANA